MNIHLFNLDKDNDEEFKKEHKIVRLTSTSWVVDNEFIITDEQLKRLQHEQLKETITNIPEPVVRPRYSRGGIVPSYPQLNVEVNRGEAIIPYNPFDVSIRDNNYESYPIMYYTNSR